MFLKTLSLSALNGKHLGNPSLNYYPTDRGSFRYLRRWGSSCKNPRIHSIRRQFQRLYRPLSERRGALCCLFQRLFQAPFLTCLHRRKRSKRHSWNRRPGQWCSDWTRKSHRCRWSSSSHSLWTQGAWTERAVKDVGFGKRMCCGVLVEGSKLRYLEVTMGSWPGARGAPPSCCWKRLSLLLPDHRPRLPLSLQDPLSSCWKFLLWFV